MHVQVEEEVLDSFEWTVEADVMCSRCKIRDVLQELGRVLTVNAQEVVRSNKCRIKWFHDDKRIATVFKLGR